MYQTGELGRFGGSSFGSARALFQFWICKTRAITFLRNFVKEHLQPDHHNPLPTPKKIPNHMASIFVNRNSFPAGLQGLITEVSRNAISTRNRQLRSNNVSFLFRRVMMSKTRKLCFVDRPVLEVYQIGSAMAGLFSPRSGTW